MKSINSLQLVGVAGPSRGSGTDFLLHGYPKVAHSAPGMQAFFWWSTACPGYFVYIPGIGSLRRGSFGVGVFTRGAALLLAIEMGVAIWSSRAAEATLRCIITNFPLAMLAGSFALATIGRDFFSRPRAIRGPCRSRPLR